mmetsp:Transcript_11126/g.17180  ORF Transcript_11126/g.17180 Transcript_11126/m.17180 type:complete len:111 (+) Transcript_11126:449-781(+)
MDSRHANVKMTLADTLGKITAKLDETDKRSQIIMLVIGDDKMMSEDGTVSLWKSLQVLGEELAKLSGTVEKVKKVIGTTDLAFAKQSDLDGLHNTVGKLGMHYEEFYKDC